MGGKTKTQSWKTLKPSRAAGIPQKPECFDPLLMWKYWLEQLQTTVRVNSLNDLLHSLYICYSIKNNSPPASGTPTTSWAAGWDSCHPTTQRKHVFKRPSTAPTTLSLPRRVWSIEKQARTHSPDNSTRALHEPRVPVHHLYAWKKKMGQTARLVFPLLQSCRPITNNSDARRFMKIIKCLIHFVEQINIKICRFSLCSVSY